MRQGQAHPATAAAGVKLRVVPRYTMSGNCHVCGRHKSDAALYVHIAAHKLGRSHSHCVLCGRVVLVADAEYHRQVRLVLAEAAGMIRARHRRRLAARAPSAAKAVQFDDRDDRTPRSKASVTSNRITMRW